MYLLLLITLPILLPLLTALYNLSPLHPLSTYPGPALWRATRLSWILSLQRGRLHLDLLRLHRLYGPVVRIAPNELSYACDVWRDIYGGTWSASGHGTTGSGKPGQIMQRNDIWFKPLRKGDANSIMGSNEERHAVMRRALMGAFSDKAVGEQGRDVVEPLVSLWIGKLRELATTTTVQSNTSTATLATNSSRNPIPNIAPAINIIPHLDSLLFDISASLTFGQTFSSVSSGTQHPWVRISTKFGKGVALRASINFLGLAGPLLSSALRLIMPTDVKAKMAYHMELSKELVDKKLHGESRGRRADFLDAMVRHNNAVHEKGGDREGKGMVAEKEIDINATILIFAGAETTSSALAGALFHLLLPANKPVLQTLTDEVRGRFKTEEQITVANTHDLPYLNAVLNEALRLAPPVAVGVPRVVPKGGAVIGGKHVPRGTLVAVNQVPAFRSEANFERADEFLPERFLDASKKEAADELGVFSPFGVGRHQCLGMKLAWAEMRLVLARLVWTFDLEGVRGGEGQGLESWVEQQSFIFWEKRALEVRLTERK